MSGGAPAQAGAQSRGARRLRLLGSCFRRSTAAILLAGCTTEPTAPSGIVSVNPCADALLVRLADPARIAAISHYSHDPDATSIPLEVAKRFRATAGTAEEVIALRPSLVLASSFTPPATRDAYGRAGLRVLFLDSPTTVAASVNQVREVAAALGERSRGEVLVQEIEAALISPPACGRERGRECDAAASNTPSPSLSRKQEGSTALLYISGDLANGSGTLLDELLRRAGFRNAAAEYGLTYSGRVPLELLAARPPAVVIGGGGRSADLRHRLLPRVPQASFPRELVNCGGPAIPSALARLRAIRASLG